MKITPENTAKKIDSLGRVVIPKSIRLRLGINEGDMVDFYLADYNDETYVCLKGSSARNDDEEKYRLAAGVLEELGFNVPDELLEKIGKSKENNV